MAKTIRLAVYFNDELRAVKELALPFVIGRSQDANLTISHPMVSRRHCLIFESKGSVRLQDLGSLNGTFLGDERVKDIALNDDDMFLIGNIRFVFNPPKEGSTGSNPSISESDLVDAEVILQPDDDNLPPPLPKALSPKQQEPKQGCPTVPSFIKPLPSFQDLDDEASGVIQIGDIIDLAQVDDKEAMPPPISRRNQE